MATKYLKLKGKIEWAQNLFVPDEYNGAKRYTCSFYPDAEAKAAIKASGLTLEFKTNSKNFPGEEYIRPRRDLQKVIKGDVITFDRPPILNEDRTLAASDIRIGNGSTVELEIAVYDAGRYKGHRLEKVRILELVEYEKPMSAGAAEAQKTEPTTKVLKPKLPF